MPKKERRSTGDYRQRTLGKVVSCTGIGLHSGQRVKLTIRPAPSSSGISFVRTDLERRPVIDAHFQNVVDTTLATTLGCDGCTVGTVEHLMAAFFGLGIDNAVVELDGPEVPIMDGSSAPFVFLLKSAGISQQEEPKRFLVVKRPFKVVNGKRSVNILPSNQLKIDYMIDFQHPLLSNQTYELRFSERDFIREISTARTFGFLKDVQTLKENGLAKGGSLDNAVVLDDFRILNEGGLRFEDEFVRHKVLDFLGDLSIMGVQVIGHFVVRKSGHFFNQYMLRRLMDAKRHWKVLTLDQPEKSHRVDLKAPVLGGLEPASV